MKLAFLRNSGSFSAWRTLINFWSIIFFAAIIYDFFAENFLSHSELLLAISGVYVALLAVYSAEKEFRRWHDMHSSIHPGEFYVIVWTILVFALILGSIFYNPGYRIPAEVSASYIAVITILAITRESKNVYTKRRKE